VADEIGWKRGKVTNYIALENISPKVWDIIATELLKNVAIHESDSVTINATNVAL